MTDRSPVFHASRIIVCSVAAGLIFALTDLALGLVLGKSAEEFGRIIRVGVVLSGHASVAALALVAAGYLSVIVGRLLKPIPTPFVRGALLAAAILLSVGFVWINRETLDGPRIKSHRFHGLAVIVLNVMGPIAIIVAIKIVAAIVRGLASTGAALRILTTALALGLALAVQFVDATKLVGLYPMFHSQLVALALLFHACAAAFFMAANNSRPAWKPAMVALVLAASCVLGTCVVRGLTTYRADAASVVTLGAGTRQISAYTEDLFARLVPTRGLAIVPNVSLEGLDDAAANLAASESLDRLLPGRESLNVVLIAVDTVRFDHVGFNGYARSTTPNLDQLAADGWVFSRAYAPYPTSNFSYSSVFNGLLPRATPVYGVVQKLKWKFPPESSMVGVLGRAGHTTIGVNAFNLATVNNPAWFGTLKEGFGVYNPDQGEAAATATEVTDSALGAVAKERGKAPWFLWAHYLEAHEPYIPWPGFEFGNTIKDAYDSEIAKADHEVGRLIAGLKESGDYDRTVFVVFSDHGEEFEEHNAKFHNSSVYEQQIRIPFLIRVPGLKGRRIDTVVNIVDIMPTVLALLKVEDPMKRHGRSLLPIMLDENRQEAGVSHSEFFLFRGGVTDPVRAVHEGSKKLIWRVRKNIYEMYDLDKDPLERTNLIGKDDELESRLLGLMAALDTRIDQTHGGDGEAEPEDAFARELEILVEELEDPIPANVRRSWTRFLKAIYDYMGDLTPQARYQLPEGELGRIARRLEAMWEKAPDKSSKTRIMRMISDFEQPESVAFLRAQLPDSGGHAVYLALALARLGDDIGAPLLVATLANPSYPDNQEIACALVGLGNPAGIPWIDPTLTGFRWPLIGRALDALAGVGDNERVGFGLRELAAERFWKPKPVQYRLAKALGPIADAPSCRHLLFRFAVDGDPAIREAAEEAMATAGIDPAELDAERESLNLETDGDSAINNRIYPLAFERYRAAIAASKTPAAGLKLRLARYLHHQAAETGEQSLADEARSILEDLQKDERASELDRHLAGRRLAAMAVAGAKPLIRDIARFGAEVSEVILPEKIIPNASFPIRFKIRNVGSDPWAGGYWQHAPALIAQWRDAEGKVIEDAQPPMKFFSPDGVLPGEEVEIFMIGMPPSVGKEGLDARLEIKWTQPWAEFGEKAILWRSPSALTIGK